MLVNSDETKLYLITISSKMTIFEISTTDGSVTSAYQNANYISQTKDLRNQFDSSGNIYFGAIHQGTSVPAVCKKTIGVTDWTCSHISDYTFMISLLYLSGTNIYVAGVNGPESAIYMRKFDHSTAAAPVWSKQLTEASKSDAGTMNDAVYYNSIIYQGMRLGDVFNFVGLNEADGSVVSGLNFKSAQAS